MAYELFCERLGSTPPKATRGPGFESPAHPEHLFARKDHSALHASPYGPPSLCSGGQPGSARLSNQPFEVGGSNPPYRTKRKAHLKGGPFALFGARPERAQRVREVLDEPPQAVLSAWVSADPGEANSLASPRANARGLPVRGPGRISLAPPRKRRPQPFRAQNEKARVGRRGL